ncbi:hypothetical protein GUITHDRAFT_137520 [Guillardia theta CCMP2712]|uniref:Uncharacterized protein n=1 Tax=Guillardia theta (strain CCMP2712) TaxID=905079 RepID=L1JGT0_GUITC|nr:hypothetical protein GUITHDRAFT_137520 [Guillardia theta CCMP2712]EKX47339.1 hypothetical protein GUITHDRAFT_137520 [Guillardia theta CCMP2712]|eukprot:XP_005834319.1 hypothetical protein GUITHDRAFT_137520 [Guillardia theta CCMP2712]
MANLNDLNNALKVFSHSLKYTLGVNSLMSSSSVKYFNTQTNGQLELIEIFASDQGYTSYDGFAKVSTSNVSITIVAVNNAPYFLLLQPELSMQEGQQGNASAVSVHDVDVNEKITSNLALRNWMSNSSSSVYINQSQIGLHSKFVAGKHKYYKVCEYSNLGEAACPTGKEQGCVCQETVESSVVLYVNRSLQSQGFVDALPKAINSLDSSEISLFGPLSDVNLALNSIEYIANPYFSRLYRPPVSQRDPATFVLGADTLDVLSITANDLGNSGGGVYDPRTASISVPIRVHAVNHPPKANGPTVVEAMEDIPQNFVASVTGSQSGSQFVSPGFYITDPDSQDYLYDQMKLYLNETYLQGEGKNEIEYLVWNQERRGLYNIFYDSQGNVVSSGPVFGNGCQFQPQCSDGTKLVSQDTKYGFIPNQAYGPIYPQRATMPMSCGLCLDITGNKFISIKGTLVALNKALSLVTYLPDPNFNTEFGSSETIKFSVNDNGARGDYPPGSKFANINPLEDAHQVDVVVKAVDDRPLIGRRVMSNLTVKHFDGGKSPDTIVQDYAILPINNSINALCFSLSPTSTEYWTHCRPGLREYIDIDEDTRFYITPDFLWIYDVDSQEALEVQGSRSFCCPQSSSSVCYCGRPCLCSTGTCACRVPEVCSGGAGQLLVSFFVVNGMLSFYPPPGRSLFPTSQLTFVTNASYIPITAGGFVKPCDNQLSCMRNVSEMHILATRATLQTALEQLYFSYQGKPNFYGYDNLDIIVNDQGYTDGCYNSSLVAKATMGIRVVGVNDNPVIQSPTSVQAYQKGSRCFFDFQRYDVSAVQGLSPQCVANPNGSAVPINHVNPIQFSDVDVNDVPYGNMTLILQVGNDPKKHASAGSFLLRQTQIFTTIWYTEFRGSDQLLQLQVDGTLSELNFLMQGLFYDADPRYQGYVPFIVKIFDNYNYGSCSGEHVCGAAYPACLDPLKATAHKPPLMGTSTATINTVVGPAIRCYHTPQTDANPCSKCNAESGCGWCPGSCSKQGGKCMIGTSSGPTYEICPQSPTGLGWRQCSKSSNQQLIILSALAAIIFLIVIAFFYFSRWAAKRHGNVLTFFVRKQSELTLYLKRLNFLPSDEANYSQFVVLLLFFAIALVIILLTGTSHSQCQFDRYFLLDQAQEVQITVDNCYIRFLPSRTQSGLIRNISSPQLQIAYSTSPQIVLTAETCGASAQITLSNKRPTTVKYDSFYCNIQIIVPDLVVLPSITVNAVGERTTTVRSSSTDADSMNFGLEFGPNNFILKGTVLQARLSNVSATNFEYNANKGELIAMDVSARGAGTFKSVEADLIVTTPFRTSVRFWQISSNLVCLTAAKGSLYVNNSCEEICKDIDLQNTTNSTTGARRRLLRDDRWEPSQSASIRSRISSFSKRGINNHSSSQLRANGLNVTDFFGLPVVNPVAGLNGTKYMCTGNPDVDKEWLCAPYDATAIALDQPCPPESAYAKRSDVPRIPGCTNLEACTVSQSPQCVCKPHCDMAGLRPAGTCNALGQCCQLICSGYSRADMFPEPFQPRCGSAIDPVKMPWCTGNLGQSFTFMSSTGSISFQVGKNCDAFSPGLCEDAQGNLSSTWSESSYAGGNPSSMINTSVDIRQTDKNILDLLFHPGGRVSPWKTGTVSSEVGQFVWISSIRYLIFRPWIMNVISYGLLTPSTSQSQSKLLPSFCPAFVPNTSLVYATRLESMYKALLNVIENYPPSQAQRLIPEGSMIVFDQTDGKSLIFSIDQFSGMIHVKSFNMEDYPYVLSMFGFGIGLPVFLSLVFTCLVLTFSRRYLMRYRRRKLVQEQMNRNLSQIINGSHPSAIEIDDLPEDIVEEMKQRTTFWFMFEDFAGVAEIQKSIISQWFWAATEVIFSALPTIFVLMISSALKDSYRKYECQFRADWCNCMQEQFQVVKASLAVEIFTYTYFVIACLELSMFYLRTSFNVFRRLIQKLFVVVFVVIWFMSLSCISTLTVFVLLGILFNVSLMLPYAIAVIGSCTVAYSMVARKYIMMYRVRRLVWKQMTSESTHIAKKLPKPIVEAVIAKNVEQCLASHGLSYFHICILVLKYMVTMALIFACLFIGFNAFTSTTDFQASLINDLILVVVVFASYLTFVTESDSVELSRQVEVTKDQIVNYLKRVVKIFSDQVDLGARIYSKMKKAMDSDTEEGIVPAVQTLRK